MVLRGDANLDGKINSGDALFIQKIAIGTDQPLEGADIDIDTDGYVSEYDSQLVSMYLAGLIDISNPPTDFEKFTTNAGTYGIKAYGYYLVKKNGSIVYYDNKSDANINGNQDPSMIKYGGNNMATNVGTIKISAIKPPTCSNWSFPSNSFAQGATKYISVDVKNNSNITIKLELRSTVSDSNDNINWNVNSGFTSVDAGKSITLFNKVQVSDSSSLCYTSWKITDIGIYAKYGGVELSTPFCTQSNRTFTITPDYKGSLGTGHTIPKKAYLGDTVKFTINVNNTNECFDYNMWVKISCKLSSDETKYFEGTSAKKEIKHGTSDSFDVSVDVPITTPVGTYNVYAELYAGA